MTTATTSLQLTRFRYLMGLYGENHTRLAALLGDVAGLCGSFQSDVADGQTLFIDVVAQHAFTTVLRLTHAFEGQGAQPEANLQLDPCAWVRVYHDAQQAEVTHCHIGAAVKKLFALDEPVKRVTQHRYRMNSFFNKWLEHLLEAGHNRHTRKACDPLLGCEAEPFKLHRVLTSA